MKRFFEIFRLELTSVVRSKALLLLSVAAVAWMLLVPSFVKGDGTAEGTREVYVHYALGGVFVLLVLTQLASATGAIARERAAKRLQLTMVRPVRYFAIALGKIAAHVASGAVVLALALAVLIVRSDASRPCSHVLSPVLPSPAEEARLMYDDYMKSPDTAPEVKRAGKAVVMRILTQRAADHYQTVATNGTAEWKFDLGPFAARPASLALRLRFTNQFDMRQDLLGEFRLGELMSPVSNITQAVLTAPLGRLAPEASGTLSFVNRGKNALMLRPRKDINLLVEGDAFWCNALRAYVEMVAVLAVVVAFGVFLGAGLGRPVALFVALSVLILGEMSPSVIEQYPDPLEESRLDRIGLTLTRFAAEVTRPLSSLSPVEALAKDDCVEFSEVVRVAAVELAGVPVCLALLAALVMPRKQDNA